MYRCRVDFYSAPTKIYMMNLDVVVPPEKPRIFDERGQEVRLKLGPYKIGDNLRLVCTSFGGRPSPRVTWWRDHALIDDKSELVHESKVSNELRLLNLGRRDLHSIITCQASNNNISVPVSTSVKLDMHFGPSEVKLIGRREPVSAKRSYEFRCQSIGARPPPIISWWKGSSQLRENITIRTSPDGNVTLSTLNYIPTIRDAGKFMACRAENYELPQATMEEGWKLVIHYVPQSILSLGRNLNGSNIKEGDDVYFECNVRSNPKPYKISWRFNENPLIDNLHAGIIISNQSLVLQSVTKHQSGIYTCVAHNTEGDGVSNPMTLNIRYAPYCKPGQIQVFGVARQESVRISCSVIANPESSISFEWRFNSSGETVDMPHDRFHSPSFATTSVIEYVPRTEMDYGSLLCWAINSIGRQETPCIYHLVPAGVPDPLRNCSVGNQGSSRLQVVCDKGYNGGLPQTFILEAKDNRNLMIVAKIQSNVPFFNVTGLRPSSSYVLNIYSNNAKGSSSPLTLYAYTSKDALRHIAGSSVRSNQNNNNSHERFEDGITITPIFGIFIAIATGIALVAVAIILILRLRPTMRVQKNNRRSNSSHEMGGFSSNRVSIPLHQKVDDESEECIDMEEKNPDVIPVNKELLDVQVEDVFSSTMGLNKSIGNKNSTRRYATLQRTHYTCEPPNRKPPFNGAPVLPDEDQRMRGIRNNFSRFSQEVTYAEFTMPRNKGYAPMRPRINVENNSVHFSKLDNIPAVSIGRNNASRGIGLRYTDVPNLLVGDPNAAVDSSLSETETISAETPLVSFQN
nr:nephrin-like [Lepeophtheirus salmonis]